jgi:hypothetical protein
MNNAQVNLNIDEVKDFLTHIVNNNRFLQKDGKPAVAVEIIGESGIGKTSSVLQLANEQAMNVVKLNLAQIEELGDLVGFPIRQFQLCKQGPDAVPVGMVTKQVPKTIKKTIQQPQEVEKTVTEIRPINKQVMGADGKFVMKTVNMPVEVKIKEEVLVDVEVEETIMEEIEVPADAPQGAFNSECLWIDENAVEEYIKRGYEFTGQKRMSYCPPEWIADKQGGGFLILDDWNRADVRFLQAVMELK